MAKDGAGTGFSLSGVPEQGQGAVEIGFSPRESSHDLLQVQKTQNK